MYTDLKELIGIGRIFSHVTLVNFQQSIFEPTCAYARWALMHHFLYVWMDGCLDVCDVTKIHIWGTA